MALTIERPRATPATRVTKQKPAAGHAGAEPGTGASTAVTVKGARATEKQRTTIDGCLREALQLGATKRLLIAVVMAITQESVAGAEPQNGDHLGPYHQDGRWGPESTRKDPAKSTGLFLEGGKGGQPDWKQNFGSLKNAPGDLAGAIERIQHSGRGALYAQWQNEATNTVTAWLGGKVVGQVTETEPYEFTRGEKNGESEDSWTAAGRLAEERGWSRWAEINTLFLASDNELRAAAPSLEVHGDEPWLLGVWPAFEWSPKRPVTKVTLRILAERWGLQIGAVVIITIPGAMAGRYLVADTNGFVVNPEVEVVLERPAPKKLEPAPTTRTVSGTSGSGGTLLSACRTIDGQNRAYRFGAGHGIPLDKIGPHDDLDCSSAVSLALWKAKMFTGNVALTSGELAARWGKPGKGRDFTVQANASHTWIEFYNAGGVSRFDTSPHGDGPSGPHLRSTARGDQSSFTPRHWA